MTIMQQNAPKHCKEAKGKDKNMINFMKRIHDLILLGF